MNASTVAVAQLVVAAIETIGKIASVGAEHAPAALAAIRAVIATLREGLDGKLSAQAVLTQIETLQQQLESNDAAAIAELRARFGQ